MTKIKLCGLSRSEDIDAANALLPDFIGFVFAAKSRRYVSPEKAADLRSRLDPAVRAVGVFVNELPERVAALLADGTIDIAQLHGAEDEAYIARLRALTGRPIIKAFRVDTPADLAAARASSADFILLDNGAGGTGEAFDRSLLAGFDRPYILAGGLDSETVGPAIRALRPFAVDVSSGIETGGLKDTVKMKAFVEAVRAVPAGPGEEDAK